MENINYNAFEEMTDEELTEVEGGFAWTPIIEGLKWVNRHKDTIARGLVDGWNSVNPA